MALRKTALIRASQLHRRPGRLCQYTCHGFPPAIRTRAAACRRSTAPRRGQNDSGHQLPATGH